MTYLNEAKQIVRSHPVNQTSLKVSSGPFLPSADGPYNLAVNPGQGLRRVGTVFAINAGELAYVDCQADSNPPNSYVWISKNANSTQVVTEGPRLEVRSYRLAQVYLCRAFNNVTEKQDETQITLVVAGPGTGGWDRWHGEYSRIVVVGHSTPN